MKASQKKLEKIILTTIMKTSSIPLFKVYMSKNASSYVAEVLGSGFIGEGPKVKEFEKKLKDFFKAHKYGTDLVTVNSATSGEHLLYYYLSKSRKLVQKEWWGSATKEWTEFKKTDEVLTSALTCTATNWPILLNNLNLRWVDVDPISLNLSPEDLESKINENTRLVTVVHWGGNPADMKSIEEVVKRAESKYGRSILIVEDCAHSFGGEYEDKIPIGFRGNLATFSLQAIKHITSGDGGFIVSPFTSLTEDLKLLRWYGIDREGPRADFRCEADIPEIGFKFHMNDISAAIGLANLEEATTVLSRNKENAAYYNSELTNFPGIETIPERGKPAYWLYTFHAERRDDLMKHLLDHNIASSRVHERNDKHSCVRKFYKDLPGVDQAVSSMISIPVGFWVGKEEREYIVEVLKKGW